MAANMRTYLLEKSRVVFQAADERNYHIFYQMCASRDQEELASLRLDDASNFNYLNQGDAITVDSIDDEEQFDSTKHALSTLGFSDQLQIALFKILAGILHLGNVEFLDEPQNTEASFIDSNSDALNYACELLEVDTEQLRTWLCHRKIVSMREVFTKPMSKSEASFSRDALAKHIYAQLFSWIVTQINKVLTTPQKVSRFIGVLDIYGFETFEINSFEQFCINYANEKLQQQFCQHVFKLEQEEYVKEKIEWTFIDFYDNQPCIDLIETKLGILDLLDEECRMPQGSDLSCVEKLFTKCAKYPHFSKPRLSNSAFIIKHFADEVQYEINGFLDKNRDTVMDEPINILRASQSDLIVELFMEEDEKKSKSTPKSKQTAAQTKTASKKETRKTVGSQFRDSLNLLMQTLNSTTPHYVRCIKPNDTKEAFAFEPKRAIQQLRACGVLETIRISAAGYPSRWTYQDFFMRYRVLITSKDIKRNDMKTTCQKILNNMIKDEDKYKFGKTKIFFRAGQLAYMEKLRADRLLACSIMIKKHVKGWLERKRFHRKKASVIHMQRGVRGFLARRRVYHVRRTKASTTLQRYIRGWVKRVQYQRLVYCITRIQAYARGMWMRQKFEHIRFNAKALIIQRNYKAYIAKKKYKQQLRNVVIVQNTIRRYFARKELKRLKIEMRSVEHVKSLKKGLEMKIITLQQRIEELQSKNSKLEAVKNENVKTIDDLNQKLEKSTSSAMLDSQMSEKDKIIEELTAKLHKELNEKMDILNEKEKVEMKLEKVQTELSTENNQLKEELEKKKVIIETNENSYQDLVNSKQQNEQFKKELDTALVHYQRVLKDKTRLEQTCENLQQQMNHYQGQQRGHARIPSDVSTATTADIAPDIQSLTSDMTEDAGYASVRSKSSDPGRQLDSIDWTEQLNGDEGTTVKVENVSVILKLQQKIKDMEKQHASLEKQLEESSPTDELKNAETQIRLQDLEHENAKLKNDLNKLRGAAAQAGGQTNELITQFQTLETELNTRREECVTLRTIIANAGHDLTGPKVEVLNELNENRDYAFAFQAQKDVNRQLEVELQEEKKRRLQLEVEMNHLKDDNDRQQRLLAQSLGTPTTQTELIMQNEISRLTNENLDLREKIDILNEKVKRLKGQLSKYAKRLSGTKENLDMENLTQNMPAVIRKEADYLGMFEYQSGQETALVKTLVIDLKPMAAAKLLPSLPAYVFFMCMRHTDYINDDGKLRVLINKLVTAVKKVVKKRADDPNTIVMWLANMCRLLHTLKQYSGDTHFQSHNTPKQNEQSLRNFDLSEYRLVLSDLSIWILQGAVKVLEEKIQNLVVPAILEHEGISGLGQGKPSGIRGRTGSTTVANDDKCPLDPQDALNALMTDLTSFRRMFDVYGIDPESLMTGTGLL